MMKNPKRKNPNIVQFLDDNGIEYHRGSGGWIQLACPFCYKGDGKFGLGWSGSVFNCFKCGRISRVEVVAGLLGVSISEASRTLFKYEGEANTPPTTFNDVGNVLATVSEVKMPYGTTNLSTRHREYLIKRQFDPDQLVKEWGLLGTGSVGPFAHRIIIPIFQDEKLVCYQSRDITGKSPRKYKACSDSEAIIPIKSCLYGIDKALGQSAVVTEGVTKVWRLGRGAIGTFGASVSDDQILKTLKRFQQIFILLDEDEAGWEGARLLGAKLALFNIYTEIITTGIVDIAESSPLEAKEIMKELLKK